MKPITLNGTNVPELVHACCAALIAAGQAERILDFKAKVAAAKSFMEKKNWMKVFCIVENWL